MENKNSTKTKTTELKVQLVKGEFTSLQASDVLMSLINQKINYHKIEGLQLWEKDHNCDPGPINKRIEELEEEKRTVQEFISQMSAEGENLEINGLLKLRIVD